MPSKTQHMFPVRAEGPAHLERGTGRCRLGAAAWRELGVQVWGQPVRVVLPGGTALCTAWPLPAAFGGDERVALVDVLAVQPLADGGSGGTGRTAAPPCLPAHLDRAHFAVLPCSAVAEAGLVRVALDAAVKDATSLDALPEPHTLARVLHGALVQRGASITSPFLEGVASLSVLEARPLAAGPDQPLALFRITSRTELVIAPVRAAAPPEAGGTSSSGAPKGVAGLDDAHGALTSMVRLPLLFPDAFAHLGLECPKGVLLHGPPGTGKTQLVATVAAECGALLVSVRGPDIFAPYLGESEGNLRRVFGEAAQVAQSGRACILFIDEVDALCPRRQDGQGHEARVVAQLLTLMDGLASRGKLIVIAATNRPNSIDAALRRPGRFDREIHVGIPTRQQRLAILQLHARDMPLAADVDLTSLADRTLGYVGADLVALCREACMHALRAFRSSGVAAIAATVGAGSFEHALVVTVPSTRREAELSFEHMSWDDIGGLEETKMHMRQAIEWPFVYADTFARLGLTAPRGILLYGPPGCSKTTLVRAAASSCRATFWAINGAQIYSPYVGDSEKALRTLFKRARQTSPSVIFLDEVEALVGSRSSQESTGGGVSERVLSTLLNEMDGVESAGQVLVVAATNRPDMLDAAFLRPGRIDRVLYVPPPDAAARCEILRVKTRGMPLAADVDLEGLATQTERYTGADLENLCREAAMTALRQGLGTPAITAAHFAAALQHSSASLSADQIAFYAQLQVNTAR
jgi:transitional endoplasmic reticulum ATPase